MRTSAQSPPPTPPFLGSEAVAAKLVTRYALSRRFVAIYPDVYLPYGTRLTATLQARCAWLWSRRRGVVAGQSAAAVHGAKWVDDHARAELLYGCRRPPPNVRAWSDRVETDEVQQVEGMTVTTPARTALDLACRYPLDRAVAAIDALARATHVSPSDVESLIARYPGRRGIRRARTVLTLIDAGAESPRQTWLRLLLRRAGFPPPQTQIPVHDQPGQLVTTADLGWPNIKVAVDCEGGHQWITRQAFNEAMQRYERLTQLGWIDIRVTVDDTESAVIARVTEAWTRRKRPLSVVPRNSSL